MPLPQYLPVELAIQNFHRKLWEWKHLTNLREQYPHDENLKSQLDEARKQLDEQIMLVRRELNKSFTA